LHTRLAFVCHIHPATISLFRNGLGAGPFMSPLCGAEKTGVKGWASVRQSPNGKKRPSLLLAVLIRCNAFWPRFRISSGLPRQLGWRPSIRYARSCAWTEATKIGTALEPQREDAQPQRCGFVAQFGDSVCFGLPITGLAKTSLDVDKQVVKTLRKTTRFRDLLITMYLRMGFSSFERFFRLRAPRSL
jgi:hypothetical protein